MRFMLPLAVVCAAALYVIAFGLGEGRPGRVSFDVYGYFYPHILHALSGVADGWRGLLWNPFQNCGQPFFGITETGLLYPLNLLFLMLDPPTALRGVMLTNLIIGGLGTYALSRELGVRPMASVGAALAFVLGPAVYHLTTWMPTVQAPYVWMPVSMWCCERLVKAPSVRGALLLGMTLAVALLPGHPQFVLFTCQLITLRLLWSVLTASERPQFIRAVGGVALALVVMLLLTAVQLLSSLEVIAESVRRSALLPGEVAPRGAERLSDIAGLIFQHSALAPFTIVPGFIAAAAIVSPSRRRAALFYLLAGITFLTLSFGDATPLGELYYQLPVSGLFREPMRFRFVTAFCISVLTGLGIDVLVEGSWLTLGVAAATWAGLYAWLGKMRPMDLRLAAAVLGGGVLAAAVPAARPISAAVIVGTIALAPIVAPNWTLLRFLADDRALRAHGEVLERLRQRLTPQDRVQFALPLDYDPGFQEKTATLFQIRGITDYELQLSQRYAEYSTMLRRGLVMRSVNDVYFPGQWNVKTLSWPLVNLTAARYLLLAKSHESSLQADGQAQLAFVDGDADISVYENSNALPRAYYVPRIAVMADGSARLAQLKRGNWDPRLLALVDAAPASGFRGVPGSTATAAARFVVDDPEHVVLETIAPERGFVFLADQYFPAWSATVNGQPTPILIANHAFRLVEVPQGPVTVEFRYDARRVWIGALISAVTLLVVVVLISTSVRKRSGGHTERKDGPEVTVPAEVRRSAGSGLAAC